MAIRTRQDRWRRPDHEKDSDGAMLVANCVECRAALGGEWPLWGLHLTAALTFHAAHWLVTEMREVPVLTEQDRRRFGKELGVVDAPPPFGRLPSDPVNAIAGPQTATPRGVH